MHKLQPIAAALALSLAAVGAQAAHHEPHAGPQQTRAHAGVRLAETDRAFMKAAAAGGHFEVQGAKLALDKAGDAQLKDYARRLIDDHTQANAKLMRLARAKGVSLPAQLTQAQQDKLQTLRGTSSTDFDRAFVEHVGVAAHRETIELFRKEVSDGSDAQAKAFAQEVLPNLEQHLQMAQNLQNRLGGAGTGTKAAAAATGTTAAAAAGARIDKVDESELKGAHEEISSAVQVVQAMKADPNVRDALARAKGVFIMPSYGRGALGVGVQGGEGVLLVRQGEQRYSGPVFYNLGGLSLGLQAGASGGQVAMLLMTDKAVAEFASGKKFSLSADAGLTVVNWSRRAQVSGGKVQDVVVWSNAKGAYAGASVGVTDVMLDDEANRAYYRRKDLTPQQIIGGQIESPHNNTLGMVLGR